MTIASIEPNELKRLMKSAIAEALEDLALQRAPSTRVWKVPGCHARRCLPISKMPNEAGIPQ
jgi:hypothetical protein